jgi:hypothetical protein
MHLLLIALFCIGVNTAGLKRPTSMYKDAIELTRLYEEYWSFQPAILKKTVPLIYCHAIDDCCGIEQRSQAISLLHSMKNNISATHLFTEVILTCIDLSSLHQTDQGCSNFLESIISPWIVDNNPDVIQYYSVIDKYDAELTNFYKRMKSTCNKEEYHAFSCLSNKTLTETCTGKTLRKMHDKNGYKAYRQFMMKTKQALTNINQQLSELFIKNTNVN